MKREFLQSLRENEQPLSKQTIDAIMAENGRDIQATRALFADYEEIKQQLADARQNMSDGQWEEKFRQAELAHQAQIRAMAFDHTLENAITAMGGRNCKAVSALLDLDSLREQEDPEQAIKQALSQMKTENAWLFATPTPPPYARGTGAHSAQKEEPATLAGALREKFERK